MYGVTPRRHCSTLTLASHRRLHGFRKPCLSPSRASGSPGGRPRPSDPDRGCAHGPLRACSDLASGRVVVYESLGPRRWRTDHQPRAPTPRPQRPAGTGCRAQASVHWQGLAGVDRAGRHAGERPGPFGGGMLLEPLPHVGRQTAPIRVASCERTCNRGGLGADLRHNSREPPSPRGKGTGCLVASWGRRSAP